MHDASYIFVGRKHHQAGGRFAVTFAMEMDQIAASAHKNRVQTQLVASDLLNYRTVSVIALTPKGDSENELGPGFFVQKEQQIQYMT